ncbi:MAG TPA: pyrroline-5-carboxylate reductase [Candidatus Ornithospirochaeta avicola]|uniref:Pyrroline-5-carboxylate reductase n=1 Tax=Candidatus Ornithospirochaeta avicola TaxID=2840896 RepID=A0A9D1TN00_9SPIO|nr:pyrroline-5-carboxylate reductase [Candidatus Ornithospirochaeta avicola]
MKKIGFIGCGNMGGAIIKSLKGSYDLFLYDRDEKKSHALSEYGKVLNTLEELLSSSEIIFIAIKPQMITKNFLSSIRRDGKEYISIAAGIPLDVLESNLRTANVARFMPNIAAERKAAITAVATRSDDEFKKLAFSLASSFGKAVEIDESLFDAFIGTSGSLIAFVLKFISSSAMAGVKAGFSYPLSLEIVRNTVISALALDGDPDDNIKKICSAKGTTIAGIQMLEENGFSNALYKAVEASRKKEEEIEKRSRENLL